MAQNVVMNSFPLNICSNSSPPALFVSECCQVSMGLNHPLVYTQEKCNSHGCWELFLIIQYIEWVVGL